MAETAQTGWASTKPGKTKYHYYGAKGKSQCNYERKPGPLHFTEAPAAADRCSACELHLDKAKHPERYNSHPSIPIARQSTWQRQQYDPKPTPPPPAAAPTPVAPRTQLGLF